MREQANTLVADKDIARTRDEPLYLVPISVTEGTEKDFAYSLLICHTCTYLLSHLDN